MRHYKRFPGSPILPPLFEPPYPRCCINSANEGFLPSCDNGAGPRFPGLAIGLLLDFESEEDLGFSRLEVENIVLRGFELEGVLLLPGDEGEAIVALLIGCGVGVDAVSASSAAEFAFGVMVGMICSSGGRSGSEGCNDVEFIATADDPALFFSPNSRSLASIAAILSLVLKTSQESDISNFNIPK